MAGKGKYKDTLHLPRTEFPMRGSLAKREPEFLARWDEMDLYAKILEARADSPKYVLHDGPPYSNGHLHYGHILNKTLKDLVLKSKTMADHRAPYVPGWDTHGLPIELAVDRELGKKKRDMSKVEIRAACRDYALKFVDIQREEFKRLGCFGAWDKPYLTLQPSYEAAIVRALAAFSRGGYLFRGRKPVYWCPRDRTALAEAEIEYADHTSPSIYVRFPMTDELDPAALNPALAGKKLALVIWTTTPWTLPANLAIVLHPRLEYVAVPTPGRDGEYLVVAKELASGFLTAINADEAGDADSAADANDANDDSTWLPIERDALAALEGKRYEHPFVDAPKTDADFRVWFADYVTLEAGTGLVHTAPGHGADDYVTGMKHGLEPYAPIDNAGCYTDEVPLWQGLKTTEANPKIVAHMAASGHLLSDPNLSINHSYAHCWRCKGPIIYRATPQWFINIDHNALRQRALDEIDATTWVPPWGHARIHAMVKNRPDWCLSRQRIWGVPIPAFYCNDCEELHADAATMERVADIFAEQGADAWYSMEPRELLPEGTTCGGCGGTNFRPEQAIVDVWFESGCSWLAVAAPDPELGDVDLYLEGSDQHRGWFHSSLLVGIGVKGSAPYKTVITHGFVLDENGHPYSKSAIEKAKREGKKVKYIPPEDVIARYGAEMFRLWTASTEFRNDIPYSETIIKGLTDWYRKLRNTCRFMLGNLFDYDPNVSSLDKVTLSHLDRYALARLGDVVARVRAAYAAFEFHVVHRALVDYVTTDLSALYLDVIKDRLYSDGSDSTSRRAAQAVVYSIVRTLAALMAPILCFTAEDIWQHLPKRDGDCPSVHLALMPDGMPLDTSAPLARDWETILSYRELVKKELEAFRAQKNKSLDARVTLTPRAADRAVLVRCSHELADVFIVSQVAVAAEDAQDEPRVAVEKHPGTRCERCWKWNDVMSVKDPELCNRCSDVITALGS